MRSGPKIDAQVERCLVDETRPVEATMSRSFVPTAKSIESNLGLGAGFPLNPGHRYCELIGSLLHLANKTRPDIAQAVEVLSIDSASTACAISGPAR